MREYYSPSIPLTNHALRIIVIQPHRVVHLPGDLLKPEAWIECLPDGVLVQRLYLRDRHSLRFEELESIFQQPPTETLPLVRGVYCEIRYPPDTTARIKARGHVACNRSILMLRHKHAVRLKAAVV